MSTLYRISKWLAFMLLCLISATVAVYPQDLIPDAGFENWVSGEPQGWSTDNFGGANPVKQSFISHSGISALSGEVLPFSRSTRPPIVSAGFRISHRDTALTGWYTFAPFQGDVFRVTVTIFSFLAGQMGSGSISLAAPESLYTFFSVPIHYLPVSVGPDSCFIEIQIDGPIPNTQTHNGSSMTVDDIAFAGIVSGITSSKQIPQEFSLEQNFPNPFNPSTVIRFTIATASFTSLKVFNALGQEVADLVESNLSAGVHEVPFNGSGLASGIYFYRLRAGQFLSTKKFVVLK